MPTAVHDMPPLSVDDLSEDERDAFEERAAIMQYSAGVTREEAEARALERIDYARKGQRDLF